jgi:hypothetical protein
MVGNADDHAMGDTTACPEITSNKALPLASVVCLVVVRAHDELEHWVWFERLERNWKENGPLANMALAVGGIGI